MQMHSLVELQVSFNSPRNPRQTQWVLGSPQAHNDALATSGNAPKDPLVKRIELLSRLEGISLSAEGGGGIERCGHEPRMACRRGSGSSCFLRRCCEIILLVSRNQDISGGSNVRKTGSLINNTLLSTDFSTRQSSAVHLRWRQRLHIIWRAINNRRI